ncbi:class I SAM-dependent methyltransferase [Candidatus Woesearchaeota archaeon]|nr:class I SAM-dependent methyltransferase [Candidatus Woesearchaeota archaeon]
MNNLSAIIKRYPTIKSKIYVLLRYVLLPFKCIEPYLPKRGFIVDLGSGYGSYDIYFALREPKRKIIGLELIKSRVKIAKQASKGIRNVKFKPQDFTKDSEIKSADAICMLDFLHHVPYRTQDAVLSECFKKLRKNGVLIIKDIAEKPRWKFLYNYVHDKIMTKNDKLYFLRTGELTQKLNNIRFKVVHGPLIMKTYPLNPIPHYIIICRK